MTFGWWLRAMSAVAFVGGAGGVAQANDRERPRLTIGAPAGETVPEQLLYVGPEQTTQVTPLLGVEAACRAVFDVRADGRTENIRVCCALPERDRREALGQPSLERGIASAVDRWRFRPDFETAPYQIRGLTAVTWFRDDRFDPSPSKIRRGFLPEPPPVEGCAFSEATLKAQILDDLRRQRTGGRH